MSLIVGGNTNDDPEEEVDQVVDQDGVKPKVVKGLRSVLGKADESDEDDDIEILEMSNIMYFDKKNPSVAKFVIDSKTQSYLFKAIPCAKNLDLMNNSIFIKWSENVITACAPNALGLILDGVEKLPYRRIFKEI